jgi:hypothetical protein
MAMSQNNISVGTADRSCRRHVDGKLRIPPELSAAIPARCG